MQAAPTQAHGPQVNAAQVQGIDTAEVHGLHAHAVDAASCFFLEGSALAVLNAARDLVHTGWKLLHHPLYGNYRPYQQPYRSLLLQHTLPPADDKTDGIRRIVHDPMSLHLVEQALIVYGSARVVTPEEAPASLRDACMMLDCELMRLPLEQAGLIDHCAAQTA